MYQYVVLVSGGFELLSIERRVQNYMHADKFPARSFERPSRGGLGARTHGALGLDSTSGIGQHAAPFATQNQTPGICDHPLEVRGELNTHIRDRALCALTDGGIGGRGRVKFGEEEQLNSMGIELFANSLYVKNN